MFGDHQPHTAVNDISEKLFSRLKLDHKIYTDGWSSSTQLIKLCLLDSINHASTVLPRISTNINPAFKPKGSLNVTGEVKVITNLDAFSHLETFVLFVCAIGFVDRLAVNCKSILPHYKGRTKQQELLEKVQEADVADRSKETRAEIKYASSQTAKTEIQQSSCGTQTAAQKFIDLHSQTTFEIFDELKRKELDLVRVQHLVTSQNYTIKFLRKCLRNYTNQTAEMENGDRNPANKNIMKWAQFGAALLARMKRTIHKADSDIEVLKSLLDVGCVVVNQMEMIQLAEEDLRTFSSIVHVEIDRLVDSLENYDKTLNTFNFSPPFALSDLIQKFTKCDIKSTNSHNNQESNSEIANNTAGEKSSDTDGSETNHVSFSVPYKQNTSRNDFDIFDRFNNRDEEIDIDAYKLGRKK